MNNSFLRIFTILMLALGISACSDPATPQAGKQYEQLPNDLSDLQLAPITEIFALTCGHCRNMEKMLPEIEAATKQKIRKVHVTFNQSAQVGALIYYAAEMQLGHAPDHDMLDELFETVQSSEGTISDKQAAIERSFAKRDLTSPYDFSEAQLEELNKYVVFADTITQKANINAVPSFIIGGKYLLITEGHKDIADLAKTINYLINL